MEEILSGFLVFSEHGIACRTVEVATLLPLLLGRGQRALLKVVRTSDSTTATTTPHRWHWVQVARLLREGQDPVGMRPELQPQGRREPPFEGRPGRAAEEGAGHLRPRRRGEGAGGEGREEGLHEPVTDASSPASSATERNDASDSAGRTARDAASPAATPLGPRSSDSPSRSSTSSRPFAQSSRHRQSEALHPRRPAAHHRRRQGTDDVARLPARPESNAPQSPGGGTRARACPPEDDGGKQDGEEHLGREAQGRRLGDLLLLGPTIDGPVGMIIAASVGGSPLPPRPPRDFGRTRAPPGPVRARPEPPPPTEAPGHTTRVRESRTPPPRKIDRRTPARLGGRDA